MINAGGFGGLMSDVALSGSLGRYGAERPVVVASGSHVPRGGQTKTRSERDYLGYVLLYRPLYLTAHRPEQRHSDLDVPK